MFDFEIPLVHLGASIICILLYLEYSNKWNTPVIRAIAVNYIIFYLCFYAIRPYSQEFYNISNVARNLICAVLLGLWKKKADRISDLKYASLYVKLLFIMFVGAVTDSLGVFSLPYPYHNYFDTLLTVSELFLAIGAVGGKIYHDRVHNNPRRDAALRVFILHKD